MEYDFYREADGSFDVKMSMGHEAFGNWMVENLTDQASCAELLVTIAEAGKTSLEIKSRTGHYQLNVGDGEVHIRADALDAHTPEEIEESSYSHLAFYDEEMTAECGLEDFVPLIKDWALFIGR